MGRKKLDIVNKRFGRLVVIGFSHVSKHGHRYWQIKCDCGIEKNVRGGHLKSGGIKSCGCLNKDRIFKHGMTQSSTYISWQDMKHRCLNSKNKQYKDYGGRGIKVCRRWLNSFVLFLEDMGVKPEGLSIERRDNNDGYFKENCFWADSYEQNNNARSNVKLTYKGKTLNMAQWARERGINYSTLTSRVNVGWTTERALNG